MKADTMSAVLNRDPATTSARGQSGVSPLLDETVRHCLEKNPADRFQSASDVAFTSSVLEAQRRRGSNAAERIAARGGFRTAITADLAAFIAERDSAYLATANAEGQPTMKGTATG